MVTMCKLSGSFGFLSWCNISFNCPGLPFNKCGTRGGLEFFAVQCLRGKDGVRGCLKFFVSVFRGRSE